MILFVLAGGSVTAAVNDVQCKLLADQSVKAKGRHAGNESHQINEEVLSVEGECAPAAGESGVIFWRRETLYQMS